MFTDRSRNNSELNDLPIFHAKDDKLGIYNYAKSLANFIRCTNGPFTIAIQGEWGCGKTSLMNLIYQDLINDEKATHIGITINVWELCLDISNNTFIDETIKYITGAILKAVINKNGTTKSKSPKHIDVSPLLCSAAKLLHCGIQDLCNHFGLNNIANEISESLQGNPIRNFKISVSNIISRFIENNDQEFTGFVFFIDDLDRISPDGVISLLDVLKNLFDVKYCTFILAIDYDIIVSGLRNKMKDTILERRNAYNVYFDKLIQLSFTIPTHKYNIINFLIDLLIKIDYFEISEVDVVKNDYNFAKILKTTIRNNPRQVKQLVNFLKLTNLMNANLLVTTEIKIIYILLYLIQHTYPTIYEHFWIHPHFFEWNIVTIKQNLEEICSESVFTKANYENILNIFIYIDKYIQHLPIENRYDVLNKLLESAAAFYKKGLSISSEFDGHLYTKYSGIQKEQSVKLLKRIISTEKNVNVLDIGCGDGSITFNLTKYLPNCKILAIDKSKTQIEIAEKKFTHKNIHFIQQDLYKLDITNKFDIVFSNSTMHWMLDQEKAYEIIFNSLTVGGQLYVHQGGKNTYIEFHEAAKFIISNMSMEDNFDGWKYPAIYFTSEEINDLLTKIGFKAIDIELDHDVRSVDENLINDFIVSSLRAYMEKVPIEKRESFNREFHKYCLSNISTVNVIRLYITAKKP